MRNKRKMRRGTRFYTSRVRVRSNIRILSTPFGHPITLPASCHNEWITPLFLNTSTLVRKTDESPLSSFSFFFLFFFTLSKRHCAHGWSSCLTRTRDERLWQVKLIRKCSLITPVPSSSCLVCLCERLGVWHGTKRKKNQNIRDQTFPKKSYVSLNINICIYAQAHKKLANQKRASSYIYPRR